MSEVVKQLLALLIALGAEVHQGYAPRYAPGVMERVSLRRGMPIAACMVSSPRYGLGTELTIIGVNTEAVETCRVTDVSADTDTTGRGSSESDRQRHIRMGREAELGYEEARRLCGEAALQERPEACPIIVVYVPKEEDGYAITDGTPAVSPVGRGAGGRGRADRGNLQLAAGAVSDCNAAACAGVRTLQLDHPGGIDFCWRLYRGRLPHPC
jgi:hypothetical protein